jgi:Uma2 family endonuclease
MSDRGPRGPAGGRGREPAVYGGSEAATVIAMELWSIPPWPTKAERGRALTLDEWAALPEDTEGELVAGFLEEEEMPDALHELAVTWLTAVLRAWLLGKGGFVFGSDVKLALGPKQGRKPDASVYLPGRPAPRRRGPLKDPPDIVIEIVTPSPRDERRDRIDKMAEYAAFGVPYYWLIDPALGSWEVFELGPGGRYSRALAATEGRLEQVPGCHELQIDLDALWAELARLSAD